MLLASHSGYVAAMYAERVGLASMRLGMGRFKKDDAIDHRTGFVWQARIGDYCCQGDSLVEIHALNDDEMAVILFHDPLEDTEKKSCVG